MNMRHKQLLIRSLVAAALLAACVGCLDEPEIDERWTLMEITSSNPVPGSVLASGQTVPVSVSTMITYRDIRTGFLVAEVRYSDSLNRTAVNLDPEDHNADMTGRIEQVLDNSVTAGRGIKAVTGFDHLEQRINFAFDAIVPAGMFTGSADSVANRGMFLVLYLAEGDEIEQEDGSDSLVVTPFNAGQYELLYTGFVLNVQAGGTP
jgi:hypothetical protein